MLQLKPYEESFYGIIYGRLKRLDVVILCEGKRDAEILKAVAEKTGLKTKLTVGVTDCEGVSKVYDMLAVLSLIVVMVRKVKRIGVLIDSNKMKVEERVRSIADSLASKGVKVSDPIKVCDQTYQMSASRGDLGVEVYVSVSGLEEPPSCRHEIEDHVNRLVQLEGVEKEGASDVRALIKNSDVRNVEAAFNHIVCLLSHLLRE